MSKRYYWLKLKEDFFKSKRIKKLRKTDKGDTYIIVYLKMQLLAMKKDGFLTYTGLEDTFEKEVALDLNEDEENVTKTVEYLFKTGLIETKDNINFFLPFSVENTGSENDSAKRVREFREKKKTLHCNKTVTPLKQNGNVEKEIEKEQETELHTDIDKNISDKPIKNIYGEYKNVLLSDDEISKLKQKFDDYSQRIEELSEGIELHGYKYKNHYLAILKWAETRIPKYSKQNTENYYAGYDIALYEKMLDEED